MLINSANNKFPFEIKIFYKKLMKQAAITFFLKGTRFVEINYPV